MGLFKYATSGRRALSAAVLALGLAVAALQPAAAAGTAADTVRGLYATLLGTMRSGSALGPRGRYARIEPVVQRSFDIPYMTRLAVGPEWARLTDAQRQQVTQAFARYIAAVYAERFDAYSGEQLQVIGEQPAAGGVMVTSRIVKSNGEPVDINYLLRQNNGAWQIADVYLNGTISELATRRSEFSGILRTRGIAGLIEALNTKANAIVS